VAAVDVGGTRIKAALVDRACAPVATLTRPTPTGLATDLGDVVKEIVSDLLTAAGAPGPASRVVGCGVVVPGLVDAAAGVGVFSVNLGWRDLPIADLVGAALGVPVVDGHDVRSGLLAELRLGAARGARHALFLPVGTGIAGALLLDGAVIDVDGWAGELGHLVVDPAGPVCRCGATGCLEAIASASAVARELERRTGRPVTAEQVADGVVAGDPEASAVWARAVGALASAVVTTVTITGVDLVVVGGGLAGSGPVLMDPLRAEVARRLTIQRPPRLEVAALGALAGCLGAACLAWDSL
jgi:glucokinase